MDTPKRKTLHLPQSSNHPLVRASRMPPSQSGNDAASNPLPPAPKPYPYCNPCYPNEPKFQMSHPSGKKR